MVNKTKSAKTGKKNKAKKTSSKHKQVAATGEPGQPFQIIGSWVVRTGSTAMGIESDESKFEIKPADKKTIFLVKKADVGWNGSSTSPIPLENLPENHPGRPQGMLVGATVEVGGQPFELTLGTKDTGNTLEIRLASAGQPELMAGGSGSAGRGV